MTTCLYNILTAGADRMAQVDPHGWTLTLISVCVVFCALVILYFIYSFSGNIFSGKFKSGKKKSSQKGADEEAVAAAIFISISTTEYTTSSPASSPSVTTALRDGTQNSAISENQHKDENIQIQDQRQGLRSCREQH